MPPPETAWHGQQGAGLHPTMNLPRPQGQQGQEPAWQGQHGSGLPPVMNLPGPQGQHGQPPAPGPPRGRQMPMRGPQGQHGQPPAPGPPRRGQNITNATAASQAPEAQQGGAQIVVHPGGINGGGVSQAMTGRGAQGTTSLSKLPTKLIHVCRLSR